MYFELIRDAAGQTNQPYERSVQDLNMHGRGFARKFNRRGVKLLLGWAGKGTTKALSFEPRLTSHKKISERGTVLIVDLSDLGHEPAAIFGAIFINAFKQAADASEIRSGRTVSTSTSFRTSEPRSSARYSARAASEAYFSRSRINSFRSSTKKYGTPCSATARPLFHSVLVPTMPHYWESNRP